MKKIVLLLLAAIGMAVAAGAQIREIRVTPKGDFEIVVEVSRGESVVMTEGGDLMNIKI